MKIFAHDPRFIFDGRDDSKSDAVVVREIWCENVYEVFDGDLSDTGIVVDLGANIGAFTLYAAALGAKKVIAVEPEPHNVEMLVKNVGANRHNVPNCEFIFDDSAVGRHENGMVYIDNNHGDSKVVENASYAADDSVNVKMTTLDALFKKHGLEFIDVLKIDIEGLEGDVILAASESTLNLCRYITLEYDQHANDLGAIVEKLSKTHQIKYVGSNGGMLFGKRY
jgi:FkbM family methyltransferase